MPDPGWEHFTLRKECDDHLLSLLRYVERNPLSAGLVERAELWRWSSLWSRAHGDKAVKALLSPWPVERPANWTVRVNSALTAKELDRVRVMLPIVSDAPLDPDRGVMRWNSTSSHALDSFSTFARRCRHNGNASRQRRNAARAECTHCSALIEVVGVSQGSLDRTDNGHR